MLVFMDFEASSLSKKSFPVELAWVFEDGRSRTFLIRPADDWTDWSADAEGIHGISRAQLETEGVPVELVVDEMIEQLAGHDLYASAPSWDGKWLSALLRAAGLPRHTLRLRKSDDAFIDVARGVLGHALSDEDIATLVADIVETTEPATTPLHRALPDAMLERARWMLVRQASLDRAACL
jgi:hypothetical protein